MKHSKVLEIPHNKRWFLLVYAILFVAKVKCDDDQPQPGMTPSAGLLCVSDCATCPVICSPPTSPVNSKPPPSPSTPLPRPPTPPVHYSPSQPYFHAPPPFLFPLPLPPEASPPPPPPPPPPPASYVSWSNVAPPPPSIYYWGGGGGGNVPSVQAPPGMEQRNYSYPYYYFYASKASSFSLQGSSIFVLLLSLHVLYFS